MTGLRVPRRLLTGSPAKAFTPRAGKGAALTGLPVHHRLLTGRPAKAFTPRAGKGADAGIFTPAGRPEWFRTGR
ncbi:hypothetical protein [Klebsiella oxytoca]|uniref:hypothetical protein n=1 Tax=Klebsiella oxytoca TaxID=571 RepID=UPI000FDA3B68|nr:hypothetical protein [Klebsiella oxytoca]MDT9803310.1 hypothetical protein [Klebsiella oxytoca]MEC5298748.1 hypothetical protein [Klebsiella oxytoca]MEC5328549.1 hypothetical protein [Klebsiella oxytoca]RVT19580.1 hypothetical protein EOK96_09890 [Klebsiella oxytoca]HBM9168825.1 hypothetical protein [Klebsiella oxytoca]